MPAKKHIDMAVALSLYESGLSLAEIGEKLFVSPSALHSRFKSSGVALRPSGFQSKGIPNERVIALYQSGHSIREVAAIFGIAFSSVQKRLHEAGVELRPPGSPTPVADEVYAKIPDMYSHLEMSTKEIGQELGISQFAVWKYLNRSDISLRSPAEGRGLARRLGKTVWPVTASDGSKFRACDGYIWVKHLGEWVREHILLWENVHGKMPEKWVVHHVNCIRDDNRLENLCAMSRSDHIRLHGEMSRSSKQSNKALDRLADYSLSLEV